LLFSAPSSVPVTTSALRSLPFANNWACSRGKLLGLACEWWIEFFGFCFTDFGLDGAMPLLLLNQKPLSAGIEPDFVCSGAFDHGQRTLAGRKSMSRSERSFVGWLRRIPPGVLREFTVNCSSLGCMSPNVPFLAISVACLLPTRNASSGLHFCAIIEKSLRPWTFSPYQLSASEFCIAFLSSSMVGAKFFIDSKFGTDVIDLLESSSVKPKRTSPLSPWQNGI